MTRSNLLRIDLDLLYLPFLEKAMDMIANCEARGAVYRATSGFRGAEEQLKLWRQGRTSPGGIVTHALPGQSAHNFGLAIDFACFVGGKPSWATDSYAVLGEEAAKLGLHWGAAYKDLPHISWPGYVSAKDLKPLWLTWQKSKGSTLDKLKAVWQVVDHHGPDPH